MQDNAERKEYVDENIKEYNGDEHKTHRDDRLVKLGRGNSHEG